MKYGHIITALGLLVKAQEFHRKAAAEYSRLFNESFVNGFTIEYTPLQALYQSLSQRHLCQYFYFVGAEERYRELVDVVVLDTEGGQILVDLQQDGIAPVSENKPATGL